MSSSDKENDSRPSSSLLGSINKNEAQRQVSGENFQYRTMNGRVIKSVVPPGKGIKVDYKVSSFTCFRVLFMWKRLFMNDEKTKREENVFLVA